VPPHLVSAYDHHSDTVLGQFAVAAKTNETPAVRLALKSSTFMALCDGGRDAPLRPTPPT
jgi:hypothetical protein